MIKLTDYSTAGGCGCKIPPESLTKLLKFTTLPFQDSSIICGFKERDDAIIFDVMNKGTLIQSLDFFSPIVDDAYTFGKIAAANSISDIFAKGGTPFLALSILGYPIDEIPTEIPNKIMQGAIDLCNKYSISLAGGHSIRNPQVIFGLSVTGHIDKKNIKAKSAAKSGDWIYLTKPLGIGIYSTAMKRKLFQDSDLDEFYDVILEVNQIGEKLATLEYVNAMTDITGFGLLGHLAEVCEHSNKSAEIFASNILTLKNVEYYINMGAISEGGKNNAKQYCPYVSNINEYYTNIISDPQTNGGLMLTVSDNCKNKFSNFLIDNGLERMIEPIGRILKKEKETIDIKIES